MHYKPAHGGSAQHVKEAWSFKLCSSVVPQRLAQLTHDKRAVGSLLGFSVFNKSRNDVGSRLQIHSHLISL